MMEARFVLFLLVLLLQLVEGKTSDCPGCNPVHAGIWARRKMAFAYSTRFKDLKEEWEHRTAFEKNLEFIFKFNKGAKRNQDVFTWQVGENGLADKPPAKFRAMLGFKSSWTLQTAPYTPFFLVGDYSECSTEQIIIDYTAEGYVTPVKDQGHCGSCWAFSSTGAMEAQMAKFNYGLPNLSEQHLIDCSNETYDTSGCDGGLMRGAFKFVADNGGIVRSDAYPYTGVEGPCSPPNGSRRYTCTDTRIVAPNEKALLRALIKFGPIACGMDASQPSFQLYTGGIYSDRACTSELNHAILIVGAGRNSDGIDYWLVKNSWGTEWGEYGYFRLLRGVNLCNIVGDCSVPCNCKPK